MNEALRREKDYETVIENLSKSFENKEVLRTLTLFLIDERIYGLLGRNGSQVKPRCLTALTGISKQRRQFLS